MQQTPFLHSLAGRLLLFGVLPAMLAIAAIVTFSALDSYRNAKRSQLEILAADAAGAAAELNVRNDRWNAYAQSIADAQAAGMFGRRKETIDFLNRINLISDLNLSTYVVYEPDADGRDAVSLKSIDIPSDAMDEHGRFMPVLFEIFEQGVRTGRCGLKRSAGLDSLKYYQQPKDAFAQSGSTRAIITEPYMKEGVHMVSHVVPLVIDARFQGIAGTNRSFTALHTLAQSIKLRSRADVFVLSQNNVFIAATDVEDVAGGSGSTLESRPIAETPYASIAPRWTSAKAGSPPETFEAIDPSDNRRCLYAIAKVPLGDWSVIVRRSTSDVMRAANAAMLRNVALGVAGILLVGGVMFLVTRRVAQRVRDAAESADRIARGNLTEPIEQSTSRDESGHLMRSMFAMDRNLNALVGNVKQAGIRLNSTATEIAATSRQQEASSVTFGAASNQIAAAVKEISATGRDLVRTMESVNRMVGETASLAGSGQSSLQNMELVMRDLDGATASVADKLNTISERSQKITTVITTITKVADQTNILSINAAIEAEKAGEYGTGFLVIAREIRRLADQTAGATLDIEEMVRQMQGAVSSGVMEMDRFSDQVRRGVREVASAGAQLTQIIDRVNRSTESFTQVNQSMQAQSEGAQQISDAMASLVANANQTVQSIKEFSSAAADLQSAIALLREAVSQFKLRE